MIGVIQEVLAENHSHASQIGKNTHVFHAGLVPTLPTFFNQAYQTVSPKPQLIPQS